MNRLCSSVLLLLALFVPAMAQDRGAIEGIVTDTSGLAVPSARVQVIQEGTNASWSLVANEVGRYYAPNLPLGNYKVTVEKEGFSTATSESVEIRSQTTVRVDMKLQVGAVSQSVSVNSQTEMLDTATTTRSTSVSTKQLNELPNISFGQKADITNFLQYLPGFETTPPLGGAPNGSSVTPVIDGAQAYTTEVFVDGAPASDGVFQGSLWENGGAVAHYGEFNIVSNSFSAEYGRTGTWFYSVTVKSGTNQLHGSFYDYFVNTDLNARDFFQPTRQIYHQNNGGFTIGGPVYVPGVYNGKNKTFFFFGEDLFYSVGAMQGNLLTIPTTAMRQGDFSHYLDSSGNLIPIFDPNSTDASGVRSQFPGNIIPPNMISAVSQKILALMPAPDLPGAAANWHNRTGANPLFNNFSETARVDHSFSDTEKFYISYTDEYRPRRIAGLGWGADSPLEGLQDQPLHSRTARLSYDSIFRPTLINHVTVGYDFYWNPAVAATVGQNWDSKLGLQGMPFDIGSFPVVQFSGGINAPLNMGSAQYSHLGAARWSINDSFTVVKGSHFLKFGGSWWYDARNDHAKANGSGTWAFTNTITSQPSAPQYAQWGSAFASFLLGDAGTGSTTGPTYLATRLPYQALFAQDEWHVTSKLSLSLGLRWENNSPPFDKYNRFANFSPTTPNPAAGNVLGALVYAGNGPGTINSKTTVQPWHKGFAPRLGYSWQITSKLVMRSSLGIYYNPPTMNALSLQGYSISKSFTSPNGYTPAYQWDQPFPSFSTQLQKDPSYLNGQVIHYYATDYARMGQVLSWTAGFQYQLTKDILVEADYLGHHGTHLESSFLADPNVLNPAYFSLGSLLVQPITSPAAVASGIPSPWPGFSSFSLNTVGQALRPYPQYSDVYNLRAKAGIDRYDSLQIKVTKRFSAGLTFMSSFTWSKNLTNVPTVSPAPTGLSASNAQNPYNRAAEVSPSEYTLPTDFKTSITYDLPIGNGKTFLKTSGPVVNGILGGWQLVFFLQRSSGNALSITASNNLSVFGYQAKRATLVPGQPLTLQSSGSFDPATGLYINPKAFTAPASYALGNTARTLDWLRGWPQASESASINKNFHLYERASLRIGADFTNPFNFVRWSNPVTNINASNFGAVTSSYSGRRIQLTAQIQF